MSEADVRLVCERRGHDLRRVGDGLVCTGLGGTWLVSGTAKLRFCEDKLCRVDLVARRPDKRQSWSATYTRVRKALEERHGRPTGKRRKLPRSCRRTLLSCLKRGTALFMHRWQWRAEEVRGLSVALGRYDGKLGLVMTLRGDRP